MLRHTNSIVLLAWRGTHLPLRTVLFSLLLGGCTTRVVQGIANGGSSSSSGSSTGGARLPPGSPCTSDNACGSQICGAHGTGSCCAQACPSNDPPCAAIGCDDAGACIYPPKDSACGTVACSGSVVAGPECDGRGGCAPDGVNDCPGSLVCNDAGTGCLTGCTTSADCAGATKCNFGQCVAPGRVGPCAADEDCLSGICGVDGGPGHCCNAACALTTPPCGASDCDDVGSCAYANGATACGNASCDGTVLTEATSCDGAGSCPPPGTADCAPFACNLTGCSSGCSGNSDCSGGLFCDKDTGICCALADGGSLAVDAVEGVDPAQCCGLGDNGPCVTISRAMRLVDDAQAQNVTIFATQSGDGGGVWSLGPPESYPIRLGWGVELIAPGQLFDTNSDGGTPAAIFEIGRYSPQDPQGSASIWGNYTGDPAIFAPVEIGMDDGNANRPSPAAIAVQPGGTLYLAGALVGSDGYVSTTAIAVGAGAKLVLGQDQSGARTGVTGLQGVSYPTGYNGIVCGADADAGLGCTIRDAISDGGIALFSDRLGNFTIDAEDFADILLHSPAFGGGSPYPPGFETCDGKPDAISSAAILLHGNATVKIEGGSFECIAGDAFELTASASGVPSLTLEGITILNSEGAIDAKAGKATVTNSTIEYNYNGVEQDSDGVNVGFIDLSGGGNTVACSNVIETATGATAPGVSVLNVTAKPLDATDVAWDTSSPDVFECDATLTSCSCAASSCTGSPDAGGMSAVYENAAGTITTTGNTLSPADCANRPCELGGTLCPLGSVCCPWGCDYSGHC
jgi:hypothetical protein